MRATPAPVRVEIAGLTKEFAGTRALDGVDLVVEPGTFVVLLGPSGSGKTTLLRCVAGIERPSSGTIALSGREVAGPRAFVAPERRGAAMVFQDYALWPHLSVRRNVGYPLAATRVSAPERARRVDGLLERVGIAHLAEAFPNDLSGGEQQRVALARALAADVGLLLFDEPLSNLDADRREQLRIAIATLTRESGATALYITHDQSEAFALADRVGVLDHGRLVQFDTPEAIYRRPASAFVARFTGVAGELPLAGVRARGADRVEVELALSGGARLESSVVGVPGRLARLFVRSAGVALSRDPSEGLAGVVRDVAFTGRGYEHVVALGEGIELTRVFSTRRHERDARVGAVLDPEGCFVLDADAEDAP